MYTKQSHSQQKSTDKMGRKREREEETERFLPK